MGTAHLINNWTLENIDILLKTWGFSPEEFNVSMIIKDLSEALKP